LLYAKSTISTARFYFGLRKRIKHVKTTYKFGFYRVIRRAPNAVCGSSRTRHTVIVSNNTRVQDKPPES